MQNQNFFKEFFKTRSAGFYLFVAVAFLVLIESFVYVGCYSGGTLLRYYSAPAFAVTLVAVIVSLALSLFRWTYKWAPIVLYGLVLCGFGLFIESTYMYLASAFFGGISAEVIFRLHPGFLTCTIFYIVILIAGIVPVFMKAPELDLLAVINKVRNGTPVVAQTAEWEG